MPFLDPAQCADATNGLLNLAFQSREPDDLRVASVTDNAPQCECSLSTNAAVCVACGGLPMGGAAMSQGGGGGLVCAKFAWQNLVRGNFGPKS